MNEDVPFVILAFATTLPWACGRIGFEPTGPCDEVGEACYDCLSDADCDDDNPCTDDRCEATVCFNTPDPTATCDDGLFCRVTDTCVDGACVGSGNPCPNTECNHCDEASDSCFDPDGTHCTDDGLFCNGQERCDGAGTCRSTGDPCPGTVCRTCQEDTDSFFDPPGTSCPDDGACG